MIAFKNCEIGYHSVLVRIPELNLIAGTIYALIGANGSGKSTLLNTIINKKSLLSGQLFIDSKNHTTFSAKDLAQKIAYVESKFDGVEYLTVEEYISLGRTPYTDAFGRLGEDDKKAVSEAITILNLNSFKDKYTLNLSDGERQLVAIARALAQSTPIIVLDEPTAFLDYGNRIKLVQTLSKIAIEQNKCIVFSSHDIDLCLDSNIQMLIVNQQNKTLELCTTDVSKKEILGIGFGIQ
jgi:iron complex transport system ATP-binding protein